MIAPAVAIAPAESEITIDSIANKGSISTVHKEYIEATNKEISKAVLGQTLTTDIGSAGSYAAAQAHNLVRQDLSAADRRRIATCFNRLAAVWTYYNYGADVLPPIFEFVKDEDLQKERTERDVKLYAIGWRPQKTYLEREYGIPAEDFAIAGSGGQEKGIGSAAGRFASCPCGCGGNMLKHDFFQHYTASIFASKAEKQKAKDYRLMNEFAKQLLESGQEAIDKGIEEYADALGTVDGYDDAFKTLISAFKTRSLADLTHGIDEARFAAQGIGGNHA
jgi:phage gp29-like protein